MSNWSNNQKTEQEHKQRDMLSREILGKFFFDIAKLIFAAMVVGGGASLIVEDYKTKYWLLLICGLFSTYIFAYIGFKIIKTK
jgi:hypothetical protein